MEEIIANFIKINNEGDTVGKIISPEKFKNRNIYAFGVLPKEKALLKIIKKKKGTLFGEVIRLFNLSPNRIEPKEDHYLSCSPWQIIKYDKQIEYKKEILKNLFFKETSKKIKLNDFYFTEKIFGHRTKIEYSFVAHNEKISLSFFARNKRFCRIPVSPCLLGSPQMAEIAEEILTLINENQISEKDLKSLIIRESKNTKKIIAILLVKNKDLILNKLPLKCVNFIFAYSSPLSPASNIDLIIQQQGDDWLEENIRGLKIKYPFDGFFQNNLKLFSIALNLIREEIKVISNPKTLFFENKRHKIFNVWLSKATRRLKYFVSLILRRKKTKKITEFYSGVGTIGLYLHDLAEKIEAVENNPSSVLYAQENAKNNNIKNYHIVTELAEKSESKILENSETLIVDPPRVGLHPKVIKNILKNKPKKIIYLSCNPLTQAKDYAKLKKIYKLKKVYGFDFYPNTPHLESLIILKLKFIFLLKKFFKI